MDLKVGDKVRVWGYDNLGNLWDGELAVLASEPLENTLEIMPVDSSIRKSAIHPRQCEKARDPRGWVLSDALVENIGGLTDNQIMTVTYSGPEIKEGETVRVREILD